MKKIAIIFSLVAFIFAYSAPSVSAQKAPKKAKTEKVTETNAPAQDAKCADKAKAGCGDKAKADCATPCSSAKASSGCCAGKAAAKPVPAPEGEKK